MNIYIGNFKILKDQNEIVKNRIGRIEKIKLEPIQMKVLCLLIKHANQVVYRSTFIMEIWDNNFNVGDKSLNKCISRLREVFSSKNIIETIPKTGYRLSIKPRNQAFSVNWLKKVYVRPVLVIFIIISLLILLQQSHVMHKIAHRFLGF